MNVTNPAPERSWYLFNVTNPAPGRSWCLFNVTNPAPERSWYLFDITNHAPERYRNGPGTCSTSQILPGNDPGTGSTSQILTQNDPVTCSTSPILARALQQVRWWSHRTLLQGCQMLQQVLREPQDAPARLLDAPTTFTPARLSDLGFVSCNARCVHSDQGDGSCYRTK